MYGWNRRPLETKHCEFCCYGERRFDDGGLPSSFYAVERVRGGPRAHIELSDARVYFLADFIDAHYGKVYPVIKRLERGRCVPNIRIRKYFYLPGHLLIAGLHIACARVYADAGIDGHGSLTSDSDADLNMPTELPFPAGECVTYDLARCRTTGKTRIINSRVLAT